MSFSEDDKNIVSEAGKTTDSLYLEKLSFDPKLRNSFLNFFVTNFRVVLLMIAMLTGWGIYSFIKLPVESSPEVKIPIAIVFTSYPGASPSDIEELVTKKIETGIAGLKNVKEITSNSSNSVSSVTVEFEASADLEDSMRKLRDEINNVKNDLPADANDPVVQEISMDDTPIFTAALAGPYDGYTLRQYAGDIQDELEKISGVREVNVSGGDQMEFEVAYDPAKLVQYGISADQANQAIKGTNLAFPAGSFEGGKFVYPIRADSRFYDAKALAQIPLIHTDGGAFVSLGDIARVEEKTIKKTIYSRFSSGGSEPQNAITISIIKKTGGSIIETADLAKSTMDSMLKSMPAGLRYDITIDSSDQIKKDFNQLIHDFALTVVLVFCILLLVIGLKEALVAGLAIPLVFFATFGVMLYEGISLNFLSMFSLILALGLLVDDAIVVVSATKQYLRTGKFTPEEAVLLVLRDFKVVLTTTTLTTVWAFLPLLLTSGIMGQYIKSIPITISVTLVASLIIALIINHPLAAVLERVRLGRRLFFVLISLIAVIGFACLGLNNFLRIPIFILLTACGLFMIRWYLKGGKKLLKENESLMEKEWNDDGLIKKKLSLQGSGDVGLFNRLLHGILHFDRILPYYEKTLKRFLSTTRSRLKLLGSVFALFIFAVLMPVTGIVSSEFFPASDYEILFVNVEAPVGLKLSETNKIVESVEEKLLGYKEIINFSTIVGAGGSTGSMSDSAGGASPSNEASITIKLKDLKQRELKSFELADVMRKDFESIKDAEVTVVTVEGGPPSGSAFEAQISGDDLQTLDRITRDLKLMLEAVPGVADASVSLKESPADYTFIMDPDKLEFYNLNAAYVGSVLRMAISGTEVTTVLRDGDETKVIARFNPDKIPDLTAVQNIQILNLRKQPVFLKDVASVELKPSVNKITHVDQKRTVLLSAGVSGKVRPAEVLSAFQKSLSGSYVLPEGYVVTYGGENEQNAESVLSILRAMVIAGFLIISTLIVQFNSFKKAFIVIMTIPLALIGVFIGLAVFRLPLSFPGLIGIVALFGIVVKNAIILVDKINLNIKHGISFDTAIVDAGKSRFEAIVITSLCTIAGILPVTLSNGTWMALGSAVIFGLMFSSFLTLFVIPVLFKTFVTRKNE